MRSFLAKSTTLSMVLSMLISIMPATVVNVAALDLPAGFKIYAHQNLNTKGNAYFYGTSNDRIMTVSGNRITASCFNAGDGIMHEPATGSLDEVNTRVTIGHYVSAGQSDLVAEVIYVDNGIKKISPPYGFTGYHIYGQQTGTTGTVQTFDIGTYPNVVAVNVFHTFGAEADSVKKTSPVHDYVQFDPVSEAGAVITPETNYYIETRVRSNYSRGKPIATMAPAATIPVSGEPMIPYVTPAPKTDSPVVPIGFGASITLYPTNKSGISVPEDSIYTTNNDKGIILKSTGAKAAGPYMIEDVANSYNMGNGISSIKVAAGATIEKTKYDATYKWVTALVNKVNGTSVLYTPTEGILEGVETRVEIPYFVRVSCSVGLSAIVTYDGDKTASFVLNPDGNAVPDGPVTFDVPGVYKNLKSVEIVTPAGNYSNIYLPACSFIVVNDHPGQPAPPELHNRKYEKPDILQVPPAVPKQLPVANTASYISINEVCSSNKMGIEDAFGKKPDWIELYNDSDININIKGCRLSDNPKKPTKWTFPDAVVPAKGCLLVYASGEDTVQSGQIHTNFSISAGESIVLSDKNGGIISVMNLPILQNDRTLARYPNGSNNLRVMYPTPNAENAEHATICPFVPAPAFDAESGFHTDAFNLTMSSAPGTKIYYTLDGSEPSEDNVGKVKPTPAPLTTPVPKHIETQGVTYVSDASNFIMPLYNRTVESNLISAYLFGGNRGVLAGGNAGPAVTDQTFAPPVNIDKATVVKAMAVDADGNRSEIITKNYFVGLNINNDYNNEPVISIVTDEKDFYDGGTGLFINPNDRGDLWTRKVHMSFFEGDGSLVLEQDCDLSLRGNGARYIDTQKSFTISASGNYGNGKFEHDVFNGQAVSKIDGKPITSYDSFALRGGLDAMRTYGERYMDTMLQSLSKELNTEWQAGRGCTVFINGEYWGHYYISERCGTDYVENHYNIPKDDVILIKTKLEKGDSTYADAQLYANDTTWLRTTDFSIQENYEKLAAKFDLPQMFIYYATNLAVQNRDWGNYNFALWRSRYVTDKPYEDGKWRFMLYDLDASYIDATAMIKSDDFIVALKTNPSLVRRLINTYSDVYMNWFSIPAVSSEIRYWSNELHTQEGKIKDRWGWSSAPSRLISTLYQMPPLFFDALKTNYGLTGKLAHLNVRVNDSKMGTVKVNDLPIEIPANQSYTGWYLNDFTSTLVAVPKEGYRFVGWEKSEGTTLSSDTDIMTFVSIPDNGSRVTAVFERKTSGTHYISTPEELKWVSRMVNSSPEYANGTYIVTNDIDFAGENNFTAIGTENIPFAGVFDGGFHTIDGINITTAVQGQGLFGYVSESGIVKNVGVTNITINSSNKNVGGVAGRNLGLIENCYSTGSVKGISTVGGIAGNNTGTEETGSSGTIKNCYSIATINSDSNSTLGGIVGKTEFKAAVINCYSLITPVAKIDTNGTVDELTSIKTPEEFKDGTVVNLLNTDDIIWSQGETSPVFAKNIRLGYADGNITVKNAVGITDAKVIIASYDGEKLINLAIRDIIFENGSGTAALPENFQAGTDGKIKIMLIDDIGIISPLCDSITVEKDPV